MLCCEKSRYHRGMIGAIGPAIALPHLKAHSASSDGPADQMPSVPTGGGAQDQTTTGQTVTGSSNDAARTLQVQQAMLAFQSGDLALAECELAPLAAQGNAIAAYDLNRITASSLGDAENRPSASSGRPSASQPGTPVSSVVV